MVFPGGRKSARPTALTLMVREGCPVVIVGIAVLVLTGAVGGGTRENIPAEVVGLGAWDRGCISLPGNTLQRF